MAFLEAADDVCDENPRRAPTSHTRAAMDDLSPLQRDRLCYRPILPDCLAKETHLFHFSCDYRVKGESAPHELLPGPVLGRDDRAADGSHRAAVDADAADDDLASSHAADIERRFPLTSRAPVCRLVAVGGGTSPRAPTSPRRRGVSARGVEALARLGLVFSGGPAPGGNNVAWGMLDCLERWAAESGRGDDAEPRTLSVSSRTRRPPQTTMETRGRGRDETTQEPGRIRPPRQRTYPPEHDGSLRRRSRRVRGGGSRRTRRMRRRRQVMRLFFYFRMGN